MPCDVRVYWIVWSLRINRSKFWLLESAVLSSEVRTGFTLYDADDELDPEVWTVRWALARGSGTPLRLDSLEC